MKSFSNVFILHNSATLIILPSIASVGGIAFSLLVLVFIYFGKHKLKAWLSILKGVKPQASKPELLFTFTTGNFIQIIASKKKVVNFFFLWAS